MFKLKGQGNNHTAEPSPCVKLGGCATRYTDFIDNKSKTEWVEQAKQLINNIAVKLIWNLDEYEYSPTENPNYAKTNNTLSFSKEQAEDICVAFVDYLWLKNIMKKGSYYKVN